MEMGEDQRLQFDRELVELACRTKLSALKPVIAALVVAIIALIGLSVITGYADYHDN